MTYVFVWFFNFTLHIPRLLKLEYPTTVFLKKTGYDLQWTSCWLSIHTAWFQASALVWMRSLLFCDITQRKFVVSCWHFGTTWKAWPLKMSPMDCRETSANNYQSVLCNIQEEQRYQKYSQCYESLGLWQMTNIIILDLCTPQTPQISIYKVNILVTPQRHTEEWSYSSMHSNLSTQ